MACDPWVPIWCISTDDYDDSLVASATALAQEYVWALTGQQFGVCERTVTFRPVSADCGKPSPTLWGGRWYNTTPGSCCSLPLDGPVVEVTSVALGATTMDPAKYTLDGNTLVRTDGGCWPMVMPCDPAGMTVEYRQGEPPPSLVLAAVGEMAGEFLKGCTGGICRIPGNATSITRQGVTISLGDPAALRDAKRTGLPLVDAAIDAHNPGARAARSRVYSPDIIRGRYA